MKTKAQVTADLLAGSQGQPAGRYVTVLAEDIVTALTPDPAPEPPTPVNNDEPDNA